MKINLLILIIALFCIVLGWVAKFAAITKIGFWILVILPMIRIAILAMQFKTKNEKSLFYMAASIIMMFAIGILIGHHR